MRSPLFYFAAFLLCMLLGTTWLLAVAAPAIVGLAPTWPNTAFAVGIAAPTLITYVLGLGFSVAMQRA